MAQAVRLSRMAGWTGGIVVVIMLPGDLVTVTSDAGFEALLQPITITGQVDEAADIFSGHMEGGLFPADGEVEDWNHGRQEGRNMAVDIDPGGNFSADFSGDFDILAGDWINAWYIDPNGNRVGTEFVGLRIEVDYRDDWIYVETEPFASFTITVNGGARLVGQANSEGRFNGWEFSGGWISGSARYSTG